MSKTITQDSDEYRDLERTQTRAYNRRSRRALAKRAGVRFGVVNQGMVKAPPLYLGIKQFKKAAGKDKKLAAEYKDNAHQSLAELRERRALEQAVVTEGEEVSVKQMKDLKSDVRDDNAGR